MSMNVLRVLIFGNLLFLILEKQQGIFMVQNLYIPASLLLNIILLLEIKRISKIPTIYTIFLLSSLVAVVAGYFVVSFNNFIVISIKYIWILTSGLLLNHLVKSVSFRQIFEEIRRFSIFTGYFLIVNFFLSVLLIDGSFKVNEGFQTLLISSSNAKKLGLIVLPFFFLSTKRNMFVGILIFVYLLLSTRALIVATGFIFVFSSLFYLRGLSKRNFKNKILGMFLIISVIGSSVLLIANARTVEFTNLLSSVDRVVIWSQYSKVIVEYPMGLGPEGGFYFLKENPTREGVELSLLTNFLLDRDVTIDADKAIDELVAKRIRVNTDLDAKSSESLFIDFISSYGIVGLCLLLHLIAVMCKDLKYASSFRNLEFSTIYISLSGTLIYGLFNSFHSGMFFIMLFYIIYLSSRKARFKRGNSYESISN